MSIEVKGADKLRAQLAAYKAKLAAATKKTVDETLHQIAEEARSNAPVDTGALRESIHVEEETGLAGKVVADADYAIDVELGTSHAPAQPFLGPAYFKALTEVAADLKANLK